MARCEDCIHFDVCYLTEIDNDIRDSGENPNCLHHISTAEVIVPPCKIGEPIYRVCSPRGTYHKPYIRKFKLTYKTLASTIEDFGKTVFLTREEAEIAMTKGDNNVYQQKEI